MFEIKRRCKDCGFACWCHELQSPFRYTEITQKERREVISSYDGMSPYCFRQSASFTVEMQNTRDSLATNVSILPAWNKLLDKRRSCDLFIKYTPGFSPEQHLSRYETIERDRSNRLSKWVQVAIAAIFSTLAGVLGGYLYSLIQGSSS